MTKTTNEVNVIQCLINYIRYNDMLRHEENDDLCVAQVSPSFSFDDEN